MGSAEMNRFLDSVCSVLRLPRPPASATVEFLSRIETVYGAPFISLWFRTRGCRHDAHGGCTMCNYGASTAVSEDQMVDSVRRGLAAIGRREDMTLLLSPSGSMFDDWEVPAGAREAIFRLTQETAMRAILCETRADTVTEAALRQFASAFDDRETIIGIGLESANPWILKYCINKGLSLEDYRRAIERARVSGVVSTANVLLGAPLLSGSEAIADAVGSIRWALETGTDSCVLFPAHVKRYTLGHWLWQRGMYSPPSLWSLVDVLSRVGADLAAKVTISWYKDYFATHHSMPESGESAFVCSPSTCPECRDSVIALLDDYRDKRDFATIRTLADFECDCRLRWLARMDTPVQARLPERVAQAYETIGRELLGDEWWILNGDALREDVLAENPEH